MKRQSLLNDVFQSLLLAALVAVTTPMLAMAQAAGGGADLGASAGIVNGYVSQVAPLISTLFWVAGAVMMGAGALKLKLHAENPTNNPLSHGIARLAVGAVLLSIPFFAQFAINTLAAGTTSVGYTAFQTP
jgi:hypothetical protein